MPVFDGLGAVQQVLQIIKMVTMITFTTWLISGGFWYMVRFASFLIDTMLVKLSGVIVQKINLLIENQLFNEEVTKLLLRNIYIFVGLAVFFKLAILIINFILDPDLIASKGITTDKIVQRILFGMIGLILAPMITTSLLKVQKAIVDDGVIQKVIVPSEIVNKSQEISKDAGSYVGVYTLMGFITPNANASSLSRLKYNRSLKTGQILIDINEGQNIGFGYNSYHYDYYPIISTIVLGFVISMLFYFALDMAVRYFNLLFFQLLAPFAFVDYMIKGKDSQVLDKWFKGLLGCFLVVFIRLVTIWFLCMFLVLMGAGTGAKFTQGTLIANNDQFVNALILLAILGFTKDLPKKLSDMFGLDFMQESSATGFAKTALGVGAGIAGAGLAFGAKGLQMGGRALGAGAKQFSLNAQKKLGNKIDNKNKSAYKQIQDQAALPPDKRDKRWANYSDEQLRNPTAADVQRQNRFNRTDAKKQKQAEKVQKKEQRKAYVASRLGKDAKDVNVFDRARVSTSDKAKAATDKVKDTGQFIGRVAKDGAKKVANFAKHPIKNTSQLISDSFLSADDTRAYYGLSKDDKVTPLQRISATIGSKVGAKNLAISDNAPTALKGKGGNKAKTQSEDTVKVDNTTKYKGEAGKQTNEVDQKSIEDAQKGLMSGVLDAMKTKLSSSPFKQMGKAVIKTTSTQLFSLSNTTKAAFGSYENILEAGDASEKKAAQVAKEQAKEQAKKQAEQEFRNTVLAQNQEIMNSIKNQNNQS